MRLYRRSPPCGIAICFASQELSTGQQGTRCCTPARWIPQFRSAPRHRCHCTLAWSIHSCPTARLGTAHRIRDPPNRPGQTARRGMPQCKQASWRPRCPSARDDMPRRTWQCVNHPFQSDQHGTVPYKQVCWPLHRHTSQQGTSHRKKTCTCPLNPTVQADMLPCTRAGSSRRHPTYQPRTSRSTAWWLTPPSHTALWGTHDMTTPSRRFLGISPASTRGSHSRQRRGRRCMSECVL